METTPYVNHMLGKFAEMWHAGLYIDIEHAGKNHRNQNFQ